MNQKLIESIEMEIRTCVRRINSCGKEIAKMDAIIDCYQDRKTMLEGLKDIAMDGGKNDEKKNEK